MTYDDIMERINKILAERMRIHEDDLFGQAHQQQQQQYAAHQEEILKRIRESYPGWLSQRIMGGDFRRAMEGWRYGKPPEEPSEKARQAAEILKQGSKTITLTEDDYRVLEDEDEQSNLEVPPLLGEK